MTEIFEYLEEKKDMSEFRNMFIDMIIGDVE